MRRLLFYLWLSFPFCAMAQETTSSKNKDPKGTFYGSAGFHRVFFTNSNIHFQDAQTLNYDFTLYKVKAKDDNDWQLGKDVTAPQYSVRFGYLYNNQKGLGVEFSYDHVKYIATQGQTVRIKGQINGKYMDRDTTINPDFLQYEHTDGANYYMLNFVKRKNLFRSANSKHLLNLMLKPGIGIGLPRTDSRLMGYHRDDKYHLAGYVVGMDGSLRYDFFRNFYLETGVRGAYAHYGDVLVYGEGRAHQHWFSLQTIFVAGFQFHTKK
jgi:hypothetical protein